MKNILFILIFCTMVITITSCAKNATCECTTKETSLDDGSVINSSKDVYHNYGNDPTCNDWEDVTVTDSSTITITCTSI